MDKRNLIEISFLFGRPNSLGKKQNKNRIKLICKILFDLLFYFIEMLLEEDNVVKGLNA